MESNIRKGDNNGYYWKSIEHEQLKNTVQTYIGDTVRVHQRIKKEIDKEFKFEGIIIKKTKWPSGLNATFTVRRISYG